MRKPYRAKNRERKLTKRGDVSSSVRVDSPDDMEIARSLDNGDDDSLVKIDSPDDADFYFDEDDADSKTDAIDKGMQHKKHRRKV